MNFKKPWFPGLFCFPDDFCLAIGDCMSLVPDVLSVPSTPISRPEVQLGDVGN